MLMTGNGGTGYVRVDWYTPDGLDTWGDGRLFILGAEGYIELRKYTNVATAKGGQSPVHRRRSRRACIDCNEVPLPFGPQFVRDVVERSFDIAQNQGRRCSLPSWCSRRRKSPRVPSAPELQPEEVMKQFRALLLALFACTAIQADESAGALYVPYHASGIYALGDTVGWNVTLPWSAHAAHYVIRKNNLTELGQGDVKPGVPTRNRS